MTRHHSDAQPPRWAERLLRMILTPKDRGSVSGDLLEHYRETIVPTRGRSADWWYVRQVCSFLLRACWGVGAFLGAALVARYALDTLAPPTDYYWRATTLSYTLLATLLIAGLHSGWRTRSIRAAVLVSFSAAALAGLLSIIGSAVLLAIWHDSATLDAWRRSGGLEEAFVDVPLKIVEIGLVLGLVGAVLGKGGAALVAKLVDDLPQHARGLDG